MTVIHSGLALDPWKRVLPTPGAALGLGLKSYCDSARLLLTCRNTEGELEGSTPVPSPLASTFSVCRLTSCAGMEFVINISSGCDVTQCAVSVPGCGGKCQAVHLSSLFLNRSLTEEVF